MAKDKDTNWVDWTRYCVGKVMDVLTFIPGICSDGFFLTKYVSIVECK
jgi:hypothetical protein